jgi:hypothetical protein
LDLIEVRIDVIDLEQLPIAAASDLAGALSRCASSCMNTCEASFRPVPEPDPVSTSQVTGASVHSR